MALHTTCVLGRLFAETFENQPQGPAQALRVRGVREVLVFCYADLPTALPQMVSYTLYRRENNIRAAAVLGVVGAASWRRDCWYSAVGYFSRSAETEAVEAKFLGKKG